MANLYRDTGIVLRVQKLGEADRIITFLTQRHGKLRAVAKGVRRTSSKFGARLEPFCHVDVQFHPGRSLDIITQVRSSKPPTASQPKRANRSCGSICSSRVLCARCRRPNGTRRCCWTRS
jgi:recombinational DNA repair protein (RecF pathway)